MAQPRNLTEEDIAVGEGVRLGVQLQLEAGFQFGGGKRRAQLAQRDWPQPRFARSEGLGVGQQRERRRRAFAQQPA